ncbi:hypothetical protein HDU80_006835 [Chytriomyces hyalinus]|nr:hypothetical protein HDU80_006835 [Chytriomyces hyalinus]
MTSIASTMNPSPSEFLIHRPAAPAPPCLCRNGHLSTDPQPRLHPEPEEPDMLSHLLAMPQPRRRVSIALLVEDGVGPCEDSLPFFVSDCDVESLPTDASQSPPPSPSDDDDDDSDTTCSLFFNTLTKIGYSSEPVHSLLSRPWDHHQPYELQMGGYRFPPFPVYKQSVTSPMSRSLTPTGLETRRQSEGDIFHHDDHDLFSRGILDDHISTSSPETTMHVPSLFLNKPVMNSSKQGGPNPALSENANECLHRGCHGLCLRPRPHSQSGPVNTPEALLMLLLPLSAEADSGSKESKFSHAATQSVHCNIVAPKPIAPVNSSLSQLLAKYSV